MNRLPLLLFLLLPSALPARAQSATVPAARSPAPVTMATSDSVASQAAAKVRAATLATQRQGLRQARQLELDRRYESAWQLLQRLDSTNTNPAVVVQKASLALNYYTATEGLTRFAFRNLRLTDPAPDSLRLLNQDTARHRFAVRQVLERLRRQHPDNYRLARALGDYFYAVQQCDCAEQGLGEDEVFRRTILAYQEAHAHGQGDYVSYFALGYAYQRLGQFEESLPPFERSLQLRPNNPTVHLNLAFVLLELRDLEKARYHARSAQFLFPDAPHKEDAGFLMAQIEERIAQAQPTKEAAPASAEAPEKPAAAPATPEPAKTESVKPAAEKTPPAPEKSVETSEVNPPKKPASKKAKDKKKSEPAKPAADKAATSPKTE
ncbi:tetratricopeptide repeat protein [Hymenobacter sp. NST-14]|uniref:tetratricopeptide repeat protein n=1 Tax=Hymenobacter piscis TaxID=2839984 RepID=UPI001C020434|nr:tetratricopeptide repeat protein [Hymenobacter piscis]MBT9392155.1 tetratricopeptide repeat protein [Hymenobacter piscis]